MFNSQSVSFSPLRYVLYDLVTATFLGFIPLNQVTFGSTLNGVGSFSGQIDISSEAVQLLGPLDLTQPARTALFVDYDGALIWGGVIWPRNYAFDKQTRILTVNASELWSWVAQRVQATDYSAPPHSGLTGPSTSMAIWAAASAGGGVEWDPVLMTWQMLVDALGIQYGNILSGLGVLANTFGLQSGVPTSYLASSTATSSVNYINFTAPYTNHSTLGTMISQLAGMGLGVGFDFGVDVAYSGGPGSFPAATINLATPRRGRTYANNNLVLNAASAISYTVPEDGTQAGNTLYEVGANGSLVIAQNVEALQNGYPMLEKVISRSNLTSANALLLLSEMATSDIYLYTFAVDTPSVTIDLFGSTLPLGSFITGDDLRWTIPTTDGTGAIFDPRFPQGLEQEWRIQSWTANYPDEGQATLQLVLNQPPLITPPANPPF